MKIRKFEKIIKKATNDNHLRNRITRVIKARDNHPVIAAIKANKIKARKVLEIGCSTGFVLKKISEITKAKCYGIDPSKKAIKEGRKIFKKINLKNGFFEKDNLKEKNFDLIICGFFLFIYPPIEVLNIFYKIDKILSLNGKVIIYDFHKKGFRKKKYRHNKFLYTHRWDFKKALLSLPSYKLNYKKISFLKRMNDKIEVSIIKKIRF